MRRIVENAAAHPQDATARKVGDFYAAWMNAPGIEQRGLAPVKPRFAHIDAVTTRPQLVQLMMRPGYASPVNIGISTDADDPTHHMANAGQARLGLPTRDYYLLSGDKYDAIRRAYRAYLVRIQTLAGIAYAQAWQGKRREEASRQALLSDPHSPDKYRVNGIVRNFAPWYTAFNVKPGDALYLAPVERVSVWQ